MRPREGDTYTLSGSIFWLAVPVLLTGLLIGAAVVTGLTYQKARRQADEYGTLLLEVESLRLQNKRLAVLEGELLELRELQQQMLRLAGIETAMGVDLQLLEEVRSLDAADSTKAEGGILLWPLRGSIITRFTLRHPGVDMEAPRGQTVVAAGNGVVTDVGSDSLLGIKVVLSHEERMKTVYANLALNLVEVGDTVSVGQVVGLVGAGHEGNAPHLHFEVLRRGEAVDPTEIVRQKTPE